MSTDHRLHYTTPSTSFQTSLPLGNGRLGASVLSSPALESFILNEVTFWSGATHSAGSGLASRPTDPKSELRKTQQCFLAGDYANGKERSEQYLESKKHNFGTNLAVGRLDITVTSEQNVQGFQRELRLDEAVAETKYESDGQVFKRTSFISHPHQVLVVDFESENSSSIGLVVGVQGENAAFAVNAQDGRLEFDAQALETVHSDGTCGIRGHGVLGVKMDGGKVEQKGGRLVVTGKQRVTILLAFNTNFGEHNKEWKEQTHRKLDEALSYSVEALLSAHLADYQPLYSRTSITIRSSATSATPSLNTAQRRKSFEPSAYADSSMFALYFHYARYLTIAGTRADSPLPLHLQGLWNDLEACRMGWSCDYHLDINIQMNYFATLSGALSDLMQPLVSYLNALSEAGQDAAQVCYGCDGWVAHVFSNIWGFADPGWETSYGLNVTGGLWMATHLIELYEYTLDKGFLARAAYPILKRAAEFFLDYMIEDPMTGYLLTGPSVSPENSFFVVAKDGQRQEHELSLSPTLDVVLLRDLFTFCLHATKHLSIDSSFAERVRTAKAKLPPFKIGSHGQLQEWLQDYSEAQPFHRHLSHTMALCRSSQISVRHTPALADAVAVTLSRRQARDDLEDIEFTAALFAMNYARLGDAERALEQVGHLVGELSFDNLLSYSKPGVAGAEKNIMVIDGNFGGAAAVGEMLVRSVIVDLDQGRGGELEVEVDLLPALPTSWEEGNVKGIRLRGDVEINMQWSGGRLKNAAFKSGTHGGKIAVYYEKRSWKGCYKAGELIELGPDLQRLD